MLDVSEEARASYRPSGNVNWMVFVPGFVIALAAAIIMGCSLQLAYRMGFYFPIFAPLLASLGLFLVWASVLGKSHCRNRGLAIACSNLLGLVLYLSYFHAGVVQVVGLENLHRVDLLPQHISFRMQNDEMRTVTDWFFAHPDGGPGGGLLFVRQVLNWLNFAIELSLVISLVVMIGAVRASKVYCESCGKWAKQEEINVPLTFGIGVLVWDALRAGNLAELQGYLARGWDQRSACCSLTIERCTDCYAHSYVSPVYLSITEPRVARNGVGIDPNVWSRVNTKPTWFAVKIIDQITLRSQEIATLAATVPSLVRQPCAT